MELVSSAIWAMRRNDPLCAAILARAALETAAGYAWFQSRTRPGIDAVIGKDQFVDFEQLEIEILRTLWASKMEDAEAFYNPTNIVTIIGHITKKVPEQEDVGACYGILCEVAHPNMLGRSLFLSEQDGITVISRRRGPSATVIEHASSGSVVGGGHVAAITYGHASDRRQYDGRYQPLHNEGCVRVETAGHLARAMKSQLCRTGLALSMARFGTPCT